MTLFTKLTAWGRTHKKNIGILVVVLLLGLIAGMGYRYLNSVKDALSGAALKQQAASRIDFIAQPSPQLNLGGAKLALEAEEARAICQYKDLYYVATAGGLLALNNQGHIQAHYTMIEGLPSLDLLTLAVFRNQLYIGSADKGLIVFDGQKFTHYQLTPIARQINTLYVDKERLLIGTFDAGLLSFDGSEFSHQDGSTPIKQITSILVDQNRLYVGTYASGLYVWQEGRWQELAQGLPSAHVTALIADTHGLVVATDFGLSLVDHNSQILPLANTTNIQSLARVAGRLWAGLLNGNIIEVATSGSSQPVNRFNEPLISNGESASKRRNIHFWTSPEGTLYLVTSTGIWKGQLKATGWDFQPFGERAKLSSLSAAHITSLALDGRGRLWVGYFDRGIDIFDSEQMQLITHLEDTVIREINFIKYEPTRSAILVATAAGLAIFDEQLKYQLINEQQGIASNAVAHFCLLPNAAGQVGTDSPLAIATGKGLTVRQGTIARTPMSLPNNYLYTSAVMGNHLFIGSLGGLIEMEGLKVVRTFTIANTRLAHNWVVALWPVGSTLYIGMNGGGVQALTNTGELLSFDGQLGRLDINNNAMVDDGQNLYVGTLDRGLFIMNLTQHSWRNLLQGLPSANVSALTVQGKYLYVGTSAGLVRFDVGYLGA